MLHLHVDPGRSRYQGLTADSQGCWLLVCVGIFVGKIEPQG